jgi:hypothetical protein
MRRAILPRGPHVVAYWPFGLAQGWHLSAVPTRAGSGLRGPAEDGTRLIPSDHPVDTPCRPDWDAGLAEARARRPELLQFQQEIRAAELAWRTSGPSIFD